MGKALIDDELTSCLLDNGAQLNFITPAYAQERGMDIMSLDYLSQEIGDPSPHQRPRQHLGGAHWVCHDERQGALCPRV